MSSSAPLMMLAIVKAFFLGLSVVPSDMACDRLNSGGEGEDSDGKGGGNWDRAGGGSRQDDDIRGSMPWESVLEVGVEGCQRGIAKEGWKTG